MRVTKGVARHTGSTLVVPTQEFEQTTSYTWYAAPMIERSPIVTATVPSAYSPGPIKYGAAGAAGNLAPMSDFRQIFTSANGGGNMGAGGTMPLGWQVYNNDSLAYTYSVNSPDSYTPYGNNWFRLTAPNMTVSGVMGMYTTASFIPGNGIKGWEPNKPYCVSVWARTPNGTGTGSNGRKLSCINSNTQTTLIRTISNPPLSGSWQYYAWVIKQPNAGLLATNPGQLFFSWDQVAGGYIPNRTTTVRMSNPSIDFCSPMVNYGDVPQQWSLRKETITSSNAGDYIAGDAITFLDAVQSTSAGNLVLTLPNCQAGRKVIIYLSTKAITNSYTGVYEYITGNYSTGTTPSLVVKNSSNVGVSSVLDSFEIDSIIVGNGSVASTPYWAAPNQINTNLRQTFFGTTRIGYFVPPATDTYTVTMSTPNGGTLVGIIG